MRGGRSACELEDSEERPRERKEKKRERSGATDVIADDRVRISQMFYCAAALPEDSSGSRRRAEIERRGPEYKGKSRSDSFAS